MRASSASAAAEACAVAWREEWVLQRTQRDAAAAGLSDDAGARRALPLGAACTWSGRSSAGQREC